jgi:hypothetical protein
MKLFKWLVFKRNLEYYHFGNVIFWQWVDDDKASNLASQLIDEHITFENNIVGYITAVELNDEQLVIFFCINRRLCNTQTFPSVIFSLDNLGKVVIDKITMRNLGSYQSTYECLGDLFENTEEFISNRELGE